MGVKFIHLKLSNLIGWFEYTIVQIYKGSELDNCNSTTFIICTTSLSSNVSSHQMSYRVTGYTIIKFRSMKNLQETASLRRVCNEHLGYHMYVRAVTSWGRCRNGCPGWQLLWETFFCPSLGSHNRTLYHELSTRELATTTSFLFWCCCKG